ncbi:MAG: hypothetical protein ACTTJH_00685 [Bacteroidales bacterium]
MEKTNKTTKEKEQKSMATIKETQLPEGVTQEMIKAWQERYGENKVKIAQLPMDDDGKAYKKVIIRVPDRKVMSEFEKWMDKNPDKAKEIMINACLLSGKDEVKADDGLFFGAADAIAQLIPVRVAIVKNL